MYHLTLFQLTLDFFETKPNVPFTTRIDQEEEVSRVELILKLMILGNI